MINKPKLLNEMLTATPINIWVSTPSFMEMCLLLPTLNEEQYGSLNEFFFCGEILPHRAAKALVSRFPNATIYNTYGPTEATVAVTSIQITQEILDQYPTLPTTRLLPCYRRSKCKFRILKNDQKQLKYLISMTVFVLITLVIKRSLKMVNGSFKVVLISKSN